VKHEEVFDYIPLLIEVVINDLRGLGLDSYSNHKVPLSLHHDFLSFFAFSQTKNVSFTP
jgi:hypothetical protein